MKVRQWYYGVLGLWVITGLPLLVLGIGFAGPEIFTPGGIITALTPPLDSLGDFSTWLLAWIVVLAPFVTLPFALKKQN
jgi:hypothetical protein